MDGIIDRLEFLKNDNDKRELRLHLGEIKSSFDYLLPSASQTRIENIQGSLSKGFSGINGYLKNKIHGDSIQINLEDIGFLYNVLMIAAMGELRGFVILNDIQGAKHILRQRKSDLTDLNKYFLHLSKSISLNNDLTNSQLLEKSNKIKSLFGNISACHADFDSQQLIVSEYIEQKGLTLKKYYEEIENNDDSDGIIFVRH